MSASGVIAYYVSGSHIGFWLGGSAYVFVYFNEVQDWGHPSSMDLIVEPLIVNL